MNADHHELQQRRYTMFRIRIPILLLITLLFLINKSYSAPDLSPEKTAGLSGAVTNENGNTMPQVAVFIPELKVGTYTDSVGFYKLNLLPNGKYQIEFLRVGYKTVVRTISMKSGYTQLNIQMEVSPIESNAIIVTAPYAATPENMPYAVDYISREEMQFSGATTLTEAITHVPGVSQLSTGVGITKPVIRGLHGNRILTIIEGFRFDNQQWQDEHGLGLSDTGIRDVEIIKGPASLLYGSDAMSGVLNLVDEKPAPVDKTVSDLNMRIDSNTLGLNADAGIKGGSESFHWKARLGGDSHADYIDGEDERVPNTRFNGFNLKTNAGIVRKNLVSNLNYHFSFYQFGVVEQNEAKKKDGKEEERFGREMEEAYHQVNYHLITTQNTLFVGASQIKVDAGAHLNNRQEQEGPEEQELGNLNMQLNTYSVNTRYVSPTFGNSQLSTGVQANIQANTNSGSRVIIPDANISEVAAYGFLRHELSPLVIEEGIRFNNYHIKTEERGIPDSMGYMPVIEETYHPLTGSVGIVYNLTRNFQFKANFAMGYRAPNLAELASNGLHEGTLNYEIGNSDFKNEKNREADLGVHYGSSFFSFDASVFRNDFDHYIFLSPTDEYIKGYRVYRFLQSDAVLRGGEVSLTWSPPTLRWLELHSTFSGLVGKLSNDSYLPLMPANKMTHELTFNNDIWHILKKGFVKMGTVTVFQQNNVAAAELNTPGYTLVNLEVGGNIPGSRVYGTLTCTNLLGKVYYDHLSRIKPGSFNDPNVGFNNIGRNITLAFHIPLHN